MKKPVSGPPYKRWNPEIVIDIYIAREKVVVSLDSSGQSLHKRGYRQKADRAPISEVLAAGILKLTGWDGLQHFIDPMCGSGTFLIEAALMAHHIPPGVFRKDYAFKNWQNFDAKLHDFLFDMALEKEKNFHFSIRGFDNSSAALIKAKQISPCPDGRTDQNPQSRFFEL
ncbi:MAG: hypothetical protein U5L96_22340 [Owenweeksia sp.]|nr:hypothetical protein [Owenweeksia sp.]